MRVALFNWRGPDDAKSGGAEFVTQVLAQGLSERGHSVTWFCSRQFGKPAIEERNGYHIRRAGSELTCRFHAASWLMRNRKSVDVVVDEVNTLPFFSPLIFAPVILWIHQIAKEVWFAEAPLPLAALGYAIEPLLLRIYRKTPAVTVSASSARSLRDMRLAGNIDVIENPLPTPQPVPSAPQEHHIGYVGRVAPSKRIDHIIRAFGIVHKEYADAKLSIVGAGDKREFARLERLTRELGVHDSVRLYGRVTAGERDELMKSFDVLALASLREGWGLVVSEAARFGVPSIVYPVAGLVDSVNDGQTGVVVQEETPESLASGILNVIGNRALRESLGRGAMAFIEPFTRERFLDRFESLLLRWGRR